MLYILIAAAVCAADQLFKGWIVSAVPLHGHLDFIPGILNLTYFRNTGVAFSLFEASTLLLTLFTAVMTVFLLIFLFKGKLTKLQRICLSAVLGGAVGNLIDRIARGYVVDMFETAFIDFAIFNIADIFIVTGGIAFCILYLIDAVNEEKAKKTESDDEK